MKKCVIVLGMRSGSSMVTGLLNMMDIPLSSPLIGASRENPKGFFELAPLVQLNERYVDWRRPGVAQLAKPDQFKRELKALIEAEFPNTLIFALKDPRITMLIPLYVEVLKDLGIEPYFIVVCRERDAVVKSLQTYRGMQKEQAEKIAKRYEELAIEQTEHYIDATMHVWYELILQYPKEACYYMYEFVDHWDGYKNVTDQKVREFVDPKLNRCGRRG